MKVRKHILIGFIFFGFSAGSGSHAGNAQPDILQITRQLENAVDHEKPALYLQLAEATADTLPEKSFVHAISAFRYAAQFNNNSVKASAYLFLGRYMAQRRRFNASLEFCLSSVKLFRMLQDEKNLTEAYLTIGDINLMMQRDSTAIVFFQKALDFSRKTGDLFNSGGALKSIAQIYQRKGMYEKANDYYHESLIYFQKSESVPEQFLVYSSIGSILLDQDRYREAKVFYKELIRRFQHDEPYTLGSVYTCIAHACSRLGEYREALQWNLKALAIREKYSSREEINSSIINVAGDYLDLGVPDSGWIYMFKGLNMARRYHRLNLLENAYQKLSDYYTKYEAYEKALEYFRFYAKTKVERITATVNTDFSIMEDDRQIRSFNHYCQTLIHDNEIRELNLANHKFQLVIVESVAGVSLILLIVFFLQFIKSKRAQQRVMNRNRDLSGRMLERKKAQTKLEERERIYRFISEHSLDFITKIDKNRKRIYASPASRIIYGYEPSEILSKTPYDLTHPDYIVFAEEQLHCMMIDHRPARFEYKAIKKDGTIFWAESILNPVVDPETGVIREFVGVTRDITEQKRKEMEILEGIEQKENLLREIHHRVKNNFAILVSLINMQKDQSKDPSLASALTNLQLRIRTMALVHEMLYRSSDFQLISLAEYIGSLASMVMGTYRNRMVRFDFQLEDIQVHIDNAISLGLIVNEIISNSFRHAFQENTSDGLIEISLKRIPANNEIEMNIRDNGAGMPDSFTLEDVSTIGLQIVQILVRQIEGSMTITTKNGTTVNIRFPEFTKR